MILSEKVASIFNANSQRTGSASVQFINLTEPAESLDKALTSGLLKVQHAVGCFPRLQWKQRMGPTLRNTTGSVSLLQHRQGKVQARTPPARGAQFLSLSLCPPLSCFSFCSTAVSAQLTAAYLGHFVFIARSRLRRKDYMESRTGTGQSVGGWR